MDKVIILSVEDLQSADDQATRDILHVNNVAYLNFRKLGIVTSSNYKEKLTEYGYNPEFISRMSKYIEIIIEKKRFDKDFIGWIK